MSKRAADAVARHIDELVRAKTANTPPEPDAVRWADGVDGRIFDTLVRWGLINSRSNRFGCDGNHQLGAFCEAYVTGRTDGSEATRTKYGNTKRFLVGMFGEARPLQSITRADAKAWQRWLMKQPARRDKEGRTVKTLAESTASKHVKRAKTMFTEAVDARLIDTSPMDTIKGGDEVNRERDFFVNRSMASKVLDACPDHSWRLAFGFARFGGFRVCELLSITWSDVLWDERKIRINSPRTGLRFCPIFPEILPILEAAFEAAPAGQIRCLARFVINANLGTQMHRIIERAGLVPWEKTFQNLRASRRTELDERYPSHVADAWMGHDYATARKHYSQVTPDHWALGASMMSGFDLGKYGGVISAHPLASTAIETRKNPVNQAIDDAGLLGFIAADAPTRAPTSIVKTSLNTAESAIAEVDTEMVTPEFTPITFGHVERGVVDAHDVSDEEKILILEFIASLKDRR